MKHGLTLKKGLHFPPKNLNLTFQAQKPLQQASKEPATNPNEPFQTPYVVNQLRSFSTEPDQLKVSKFWKQFFLFSLP